ncbi:hypothetical protein LCGC14_1036370 [marine sediment metagenome]|uniref:Uncharacterized protein n=1 Tax=marine sediment metagenome TaxID=412755 RepID=A0A0F9QBA1_9ZZZZ
MPEKLLITRLDEFGINPQEWCDPWAARFHPGLIGEDTWLCEEPFTSGSWGEIPVWEPEKHAARVRFVMQSPVLRARPIEIDCAVHGGYILAQPVVLDGWHRLHAAWALRTETILGEFGGRLDLLDYLTGATDERPED